MTSTRNATLAQIVADSLRQSIKYGMYQSGERLVELAIAQELNVSQNTVRDALRALERDGWVVYRARRGCYVRRFNADEAHEIYTLWANVEKLALHWIAERMQRVDVLAKLRPHIETARSEMDADHWEEARDQLFEFHKVLAGLSGRHQTEAILNQLHNQAYILDVDFNENAPEAESLRESRLLAYEHLLGIIKFGTMEAVEQAVVKHVLELGKPVVRWLAMNS